VTGPVRGTAVLSASERKALAVVAGVCLIAQIASAAWIARTFETPNASSQIARHLAATGEFAATDATQPGGAATLETPRAYQLPGEPLYLAAGFRLLPQAAWRYLHVPVATSFVVAIGLVGCLAGGAMVGLVSGLVAAVHPFVLVHGPVWDDAVLAAAIDWWIVAGVMIAVERGVSPLVSVMLFGAAAIAALTRSQSQAVLIAIAVVLLAIPMFRRARLAAGAVLIGVLAGLCAWGVRNDRVLGTFEIGSTHDGKTLFESNCSHTRANVRETGHVGGAMAECDGFTRIAAQSLSETQLNRAFSAAAWRHIVSHPMEAIKTSIFKLGLSVTGADVTAAPASARNVMSTGVNAVLVVLGIIGFGRLWRAGARRPAVRALAACAGIGGAVTAAMLLIGPVGFRYGISFAGFLFVGSGASLSQGRASSLAKRALDVALSGAGLIASMPVWAVIAALIKIEDRGEIFYGQDRVGEGGRVFRVLKFRSMIPDAEAAVGALQASAHDPRITRVGRWLRATAADELPQLWNIFRGDMSFVGPRALRPGEIEVGGSGEMVKLEEVPGFAERCRVRPGLTGVAQIYAPRDIPRRHKFQYDRIYIRRRSLGLDLRLILLSFWITFRGTWEVRGQKF